MIIERIEQRVLGAIEFIDALTGVRVREALKVKAPSLRLSVNASSLYVIRDAAKLTAHTAAFAAPPATPAFEAEAYPLQISDPQRRYLARAAQVKLPRKDLPASDPGSLLRPVQVAVYPSMARPVDPAWASARVFVYVTESGNRIGVANALLKLTPGLDSAEARYALTDRNGEALLAVAGVQPVLPSGGADDDDPHVVYTRNFSAALLVALDADVARRGDATPPLPLPDPDLIQSRLAANNPAVSKLSPPAVQLSAGVTQRVEVEVTL